MLLLFLLGVLLFGLGFVGFLFKLAAIYVVILLIAGAISFVAGFLFK